MAGSVPFTASLAASVAAGRRVGGLPVGSAAVRAALLALAAVVAYGASLKAGVVWDDDAAVATNPEIRSLREPWRFFADPTTAGPSNWASRHLYRPLRTLAYALEWQLFSGAAWGFHLTSLLFHAAGAAAVGWATALLFGRGGWLAAALWLVHPALSDNVLYLAAQGNLLCVLFTASAVAAHLRWLSGGGALVRGGSLAAAAAAMLSYEAGVVMPALLLLAEAVRWRQGEGLRGGVLGRHLPHWLVAGAYLGLHRLVVQPFPPSPWWGGSWGASLVLQLRLWLEGWRLTVLPLGQLPRYTPADTPPWATAQLAVAFHLALAAAAVLAWRRRRPVWLGPAVVWWVVAQATTANVLWPNAGYPFAPRFLVLALALPVMGVAAELSVLGEGRPGVWLVGLAVVGLFVAEDRRQAGIYRDGRTFFAYLLARNPSDPLARFNLAMLLYRQGQLRAAAEEFDAVRGSGAFAGAAAAMQGEILRRVGQRDGARRAYLEALQLEPDHPGARLGLAELALEAGDAAGARRWLEALGPPETAPPLVAGQLALMAARVAAATGDCAGAREMVEGVMGRRPASPRTLFGAGKLLAACGDQEGGQRWRRRAAEAVAAEGRFALSGVVW